MYKEKTKIRVYLSSDMKVKAYPSSPTSILIWSRPFVLFYLFWKALLFRILWFKVIFLHADFSKKSCFFNFHFECSVCQSAQWTPSEPTFLPPWYTIFNEIFILNFLSRMTELLILLVIFYILLLCCKSLPKHLAKLEAIKETIFAINTIQPAWYFIQFRSRTFNNKQ